MSNKINKKLNITVSGQVVNGDFDLEAYATECEESGYEVIRNDVEPCSIQEFYDKLSKISKQ